MFKELADRLRTEWGDKPDVRLIVTNDLGMALLHEKKPPGTDVWKGTGILKCGNLYFVPMESIRSRGHFAAFESMLAKHRIIKDCESIFNGECDADPSKPPYASPRTSDPGVVVCGENWRKDFQLTSAARR